MTKVANTVLQWFADNFKILAVAAAAGAAYAIANAAQLGIDDRGKALIGLFIVVLAATDPNRDHQSGTLTVSLADQLPPK